MYLFVSLIYDMKPSDKQQVATAFLKGIHMYLVPIQKHCYLPRKVTAWTGRKLVCRSGYSKWRRCQTGSQLHCFTSQPVHSHQSLIGCHILPGCKTHFPCQLLQYSKVVEGSYGASPEYSLGYCCHQKASLPEELVQEGSSEFVSFGSCSRKIISGVKPVLCS